MKRIAALIMLCAVLFLPLCSCTDAREINSWAHAYIIGVDKGVADKLRFTILIPTLQQGGQGGGSGGMGQSPQSEGETAVISIDCPTLFSGLNQMDSFLSRRVNYTHAEMFVIGEELAKQGITPFMEGMRMAREVRLDMNVVVVKGQAGDFIESFDPVLGESVPGVLEGLIFTQELSGLTDQVTYLEMLQDLKSVSKQASCALGAVNDFSNYLPPGSDGTHIEVTELTAGEIARKGGNPIELLGTAVFRGDKLVGQLNVKETRSLLMIKGEFIIGSVTMHDPLDSESYITTQLVQEKSPQVRVSLDGEIPVIDIKLFLEGSIQNQQSEFMYQTPELKPVLEKACAQFVADGIAGVVSKCQSLGCDIFGFGKKAASNFYTIREWESFGWGDKFKEAEVNIEVCVKIMRTGIIVEYNPIQKEGGK